MLEVGGGEGVLTAELARAARAVHVVELDERLRPQLERVAALAGNVDLHFADALRIDLAALDPAPTTVVANLPYAIATPLILRTIAELPGRRPLDGDGPARDRRPAARRAGLEGRTARRASSSSTRAR